MSQTRISQSVWNWYHSLKFFLIALIYNSSLIKDMCCLGTELARSRKSYWGAKCSKLHCQAFHSQKAILKSKCNSTTFLTSKMRVLVYSKIKMNVHYCLPLTRHLPEEEFKLLTLEVDV